MNATMSNIQILTVACAVALVLMSYGAEGASLKPRHSDPSYRLILDSDFKTSTNPIKPINNDSISPWTYTFTHDDNLYPSNIAEAKCSLTGCLMDGVEDQDYQSRPIYTQIMVLKRVTGQKPNYSFKLEYKTIAVGCTCVRPYVEQV